MHIRHIAILTIATIATSALAQDSRKFETINQHGTNTTHELAPAQNFSDTQQTASFDFNLDGDILWTTNLTDAIYNNTAIMLPSQSLAIGTWLNDPMQAQEAELVGDGTPLWTFDGTNFQVSASEDGDVIAAVDLVQADQSVTLYRFTAGSGTPDWSYNIRPAAVPANKAVRVSRDGSIIGLLVTLIEDPQKTRFYYFDADSATPLGSYDPGATFARALEISDNGRYAAIYAQAGVYVYDTSAGNERYAVNAGASNDAISISGDGNTIAYGWSNLYVRQWNGSTYEILFQNSQSGYYLGEVQIAPDGSTLAAGYYASTFRRNRVDLYELPNTSPAWTKLYDQAAGDYQDLPSDIAFTHDGSHFVVGTYGDQFNTNPEVQVFERSSSTPVMTIDSPGSMFDVDIAKNTAGSIYITACGKHVHANQFGRGGDLYSARIGGQEFPIGDMNCDGVVNNFDIDPFVLALTEPAAYQAQYPNCDINNGDINGDGAVNNFDIDPFVQLLTGK